jgi:ribosomal protein L12E/L44/L45/RPP1/RPP2
VTLGFNVTHGLAAKDSFGLLVGKGKDWRRVRLESLADLKKPGLSELIRAAGELIYAPATTSTSKRKSQNGDDNDDDDDDDHNDDDHGNDDDDDE